MMTTIDTNEFKKSLEKELATLEKELNTVGRINPNNPKDWEPVQGESEPDLADTNEVADKIEQYEGNTAILKQLEIRANEVNSALKKIKEGSYGICEVSNEPIEIERLRANPAARTCLKHMEVSLD